MTWRIAASACGRGLARFNISFRPGRRIPVEILGRTASTRTRARTMDLTVWAHICPVTALGSCGIGLGTWVSHQRLGSSLELPGVG